MYQRCLWMSPGWYIKSAHDITSDARRGRSSAGSDLGASHKSLIQSEPVALDLAHPHKLWSWRANGAEKWNHFGHRLLLPPFFRRAHRPRRCLSRILRRLLREAYFWPVPACMKIPAKIGLYFMKIPAEILDWISYLKNLGCQKLSGIISCKTNYSKDF